MDRKKEEKIKFAEEILKDIQDYFPAGYENVECEIQEKEKDNGMIKTGIVFFHSGKKPGSWVCVDDFFEEADKDLLREKEGFGTVGHGNADGTGTEDRILLFVGRLNYEKRPLDMFRILDMLNEDRYKLIIIGDGILWDEVCAKAREYGNRVKVHRQIPHDKMWQYYVMSDYFVNLWDREIFGMAITEAIYYMVPSFLISAPGPRVIAAGMDNAFICSSIG